MALARAHAIEKEHPCRAREGAATPDATEQSDSRTGARRTVIHQIEDHPERVDGHQARQQATTTATKMGIRRCATSG